MQYVLGKISDQNNMILEQCLLKSLCLRKWCKRWNWLGHAGATTYKWCFLWRLQGIRKIDSILVWLATFANIKRPTASCSTRPGKESISKWIKSGAAQGSIRWNASYGSLIWVRMPDKMFLIEYTDHVVPRMVVRGLCTLGMVMRRLSKDWTKYLGIVVNAKLSFFEWIQSPADKAAGRMSTICSLMINVGSSLFSTRHMMRAVQSVLFGLAPSIKRCTISA